MYHQSDDCRNSTVPPAPCGPFGRRPDTRAVAPLMRKIAPSTIPIRPAAWKPSPLRIRVAMSAPSRMIDIAASAMEIQVTQPSTVMMPSEFGAVVPAAIDDPPPLPVRLGVPTFTHRVPRDATALPNASRTAFAMFSIASPTALLTASPTQARGSVIPQAMSCPPGDVSRRVGDRREIERRRDVGVDLPIAVLPYQLVDG